MLCYGFGPQNVRLKLDMLYRILLNCLLLLPPEFSHHLTLTLLRWIYSPKRVNQIVKKIPQHPVKIANINFSNPIGLAAGLDKDGRCIDAWFAMGFGFVEVGTVTPQPQAGNPKPRLFRLKKYQALINRMGFNNQGVDALVERLKRRRVSGVVGVNIGKNRDTPLEKAVDDYQICLEKVYPYADYVTINISSPNTPGLRELQGEAYLDHLLEVLMRSRNRLQAQQNRSVPLFVKIAPDLDESELSIMLNIFLKHGVDAVIATNTSLMREPVADHYHVGEEGGLSGTPIYSQSKWIVEFCVKHVTGRLPIIAVGGIDSPERAQEMLHVGAFAMQIYTAFIYQGPVLIKKIINCLDKKL